MADHCRRERGVGSPPDPYVDQAAPLLTVRDHPLRIGRVRRVRDARRKEDCQRPILIAAKLVAGLYVGRTRFGRWAGGSLETSNQTERSSQDNRIWPRAKQEPMI